MNSKIKGVGGAIGLTENESFLQRWLICYPEFPCIFDEFKEDLNTTSSEVQEYHNSTISAQSCF